MFDNPLVLLFLETKPSRDYPKEGNTGNTNNNKMIIRNNDCKLYWYK